jgi:hypothetical protein
VLRPASTAFRVKRLLFNLADQPASALSSTTSTWHVPRSIGLYQSEQAVLDAAGARGAKEKPFDLLVSGLATFLIGWTLASFYLSEDKVRLADRAASAALIVAAVALRFAWLGHMHRQRRRPPETWTAPTGGRLPVTRRVVDIRPATESAGMAIGLVTVPIVWHRLTRQLGDLSREAHAQRRGWPKRGTNLLAPLAALAALFFAPFVFAIRTLRLARLTSRGLRDGGVLALAAVTALSLIGWLGFLVLPEESSLGYAAFLLLWLSMAAGVGVAQWVQNGLVREYAVAQTVDPGRDAIELPVQFHPPPGWPAPPVGFAPTPGWRPDRAWEPAPPGWHLWTTGQTTR